MLGAVSASESDGLSECRLQILYYQSWFIDNDHRFGPWDNSRPVTSKEKSTNTQKYDSKYLSCTVLHRIRTSCLKLYRRVNNLSQQVHPCRAIKSVNPFFRMLLPPLLITTTTNTTTARNKNSNNNDDDNGSCKCRSETWNGWIDWILLIYWLSSIYNFLEWCLTVFPNVYFSDRICLCSLTR